MFFICIFIILSVSIISYYRSYNHWYSKNIPCFQNEFANSKQHLGYKYQNIYRILKKRNLEHGGVYLQFRPNYIAGDLNLIKNILSRDFEYFPNRGLYYNAKSDPLSCHIFNLSGEKWKTLRAKLNPLFTSAKVKLLFPIFLSCQEKLLQQLEAAFQPTQIKNCIDSFISDIIERSVFGLTWQNQNDSPLQTLIRQIFKRSKTRKLKGFLVENFPNLGEKLNISLIPREASQIFLKVVEDGVKYRKENKMQSCDFLQFLIELDLQVNQIAAQCFIFFLAGMSTSPSAATFALYEIARNVEIQEKLRKEINQARKLTYESIEKMKYLELVLNEALRMYPPAAYLNRQCAKKYKNLEKGTLVTIPVMGLHYDENFFPKPEIFNPHRFKTKSSKAFLPFGDGPRICLGRKFGLIQTKLAIISVIKNYKISVSPKTKQPLEMIPSTLVLTPKDGIWLNLKKLEEL